jgi:ubiquinone/menaquinone biosynthesis C-methylase UbiE
MNNFEKKYYEAGAFWKEGILSTGVNKIRFDETINLIPDDVKTLADIGCGNGVLAAHMEEKKLSIKVMGIDRSEEALKYVKTDKAIGDVTAIPLGDKEYDCVTCLQVLEHIPVNNYSTALFELSRISKKYIIIGVPFQEDLTVNATQCPQCKSFFNSDMHLRSYNMDDMNNLFMDYGFHCVKQLNVVKSQKFVGLDTINKWRSGFTKRSKSFNSPLCPICGFENSAYAVTAVEGQTPIVETNGTGIKGLLKKTWPKKEVAGYWVIALYQRK